ncbi:tRNA-dihydrouridine synthase [Candidatus Saccharibacteria bacterium]|nr:tRNA-dihydrouridine synthase [Candidatus Saccharibacteria bacterium]
MASGFWDQFERGFTCLAPMDGVTDIVFRQVVARAGRPDIFFTEFTNVSSYASEKGRANAMERLQFLPDETPIVAQIWGVNPEHFEITAAGLREMGYSAVDINMGCPEKHVVRNGGGSALIKTPELAAEIIAATKRSDLEVSVKTRLGYSRVAEWHEWLSFLLKQDLAALTVHLRTKKEMSKVGAHFELVPEIVALRDELAPKTKLIINGDIKDRADGQRFVDMGVDGLMIGRGVFANPFCFRSSDSGFSEHTLRARPSSRGAGAGVGLEIDGQRPSLPHVLQNPNVELLKYHLNLFDQYKRTNFEPLKRFFKIYINNFPGASEVREQLMECKNTQEVRDILKMLEEEKYESNCLYKAE